MSKQARVPYQSILDPEVFKGQNDLHNVPVTYFLPGEFPPTELCQYCPKTQEHDPTQQHRLAIGSVNGLRICQFHLDLFSRDPESARLP